MSTLLDATIVRTQANPDVKASVIEFVRGVASQIDAAKNDPILVAKLSSQLKGAATAIGQSVAANIAEPHHAAVPAVAAQTPAQPRNADLPPSPTTPHDPEGWRPPHTKKGSSSL